MSDEKWFDALNGTTFEPNSDEEREAAALRAVILKEYHSEDDAFVPDEASLQRMLFRCRKEGVLNEKRSKRTGWLKMPLALAASLMLIVGVTVVYKAQIADQGPEIEYRGVVDKGLVTIEVADPFTEMKRLKKLLESYSIKPAVHQSGDAWIVDAEIPQGASEALYEALKQFSFTPDMKTLHVSFEKEPR